MTISPTGPQIERAIHDVQIKVFGRIIDADYQQRQWAKKFGGPKMRVFETLEAALAFNAKARRSQARTK